MRGNKSPAFVLIPVIGEGIVQLGRFRLCRAALTKHTGPVTALPDCHVPRSVLGVFAIRFASGFVFSQFDLLFVAEKSKQMCK